MFARGGPPQPRAQAPARGSASTAPPPLPPPPAKQQQPSWSALAAATAAAAVLLAAPLAPQPANALLSSPNARIPRTAEAALRRSIPAFNPDVLAVQKRVENVAFLLRIPQRKPWGSMAADVDAALALVQGSSGGAGAVASGAGAAAAATTNSPGPLNRALLDGVPSAEIARGEAALARLENKLGGLKQAVAAQQADWAGARCADALNAAAELELLEAPGLAYQLPPQYAKGRPVLAGRATVRLEVERADGALAFADDDTGGGLSTRGIVEVTLDGYSAPLTAGQLAANVRSGLYDGTRVAASFASVLVGPSPEISPRDAERAPVPLEMLPQGEFDPVYRLPLDVAGGELPVLPLSIEGAVGLARLPDGDPAFVSGSQVFFGKFDKSQAGLSGLAFDEGQLPVAGYVTKGYDSVLRRLQTGDVIVKAKLVSGEERLRLPTEGGEVGTGGGAGPVAG
jgi:cyclophilin family peptidyl-prolyl cis-trans isomerase